MITTRANRSMLWMPATLNAGANHGLGLCSYASKMSKCTSIDRQKSADTLVMYISSNTDAEYYYNMLF